MNRRIRLTGMAAMLLLLCLFGCAQMEGEPPIHLVVVYDGSDSGLGLVANAEAVAQAFNGWVRDAIHLPGASFSLLLVGKTRDTAREAVRVMVPQTWGAGVSQAKKRFIVQVREAIATADLSGGGSAIAEAIQIAALRLRERQGVWHMLILSDMRQVTPRQWNFERSVPQPEAFILWLKQARLLADLPGISVRVAGMHARRGPKAPEFTAEQEARLHQVWREALKGMGATEIELRSAF